jgi:Mycothiol maleylpyruvate isomerase N-terminal domain
VTPGRVARVDSATRSAYLVAAASAATLIGDPAVAGSWSAPSALPGWSVGGLAAHLAQQVLFVGQTLDGPPPPPGEPVSLLEHYGRAQWIGADLDADINVVIRQTGERIAAAEGAAALAARVGAAVAELGDRLRAEPADRLLRPPAGPWALRLDDFLTTRMMEIAVHSDDLACSVGVPTPELPPAVLDPVFALLWRLAVRRRGPTAVLRALTRAERAPATIAAF